MSTVVNPEKEEEEELLILRHDSCKVGKSYRQATRASLRMIKTQLLYRRGRGSLNDIRSAQAQYSPVTSGGFPLHNT
ncbi:unnamed protein product [Leptidea sinapis]|uniref:Uncharacterized protein n=1 Tax=Leptidea sinapis TaxID=189913 RepID=A0A5E4R0J8_9NEOP|nr:unnamed protein product [Leptidea sinapis]